MQDIAAYKRRRHRHRSDRGRIRHPDRSGLRGQTPGGEIVTPTPSSQGEIMKRREFLKTSSAAGTAALSGWATQAVVAQPDQREFYELRTYEMQTGNRKTVLNDYLSKAAIPAWNRLGIKPVGVFNIVSGSNALMLYVLIPYPDLQTLLSAPARLAADAEYQKSAAVLMRASIDNPAYVRYESSLLWEFKNVPRLR